MRAVAYHRYGQCLGGGVQIDAGRSITHRFGLAEFAEAYDVFGRAAETGALKVVLSRR